MGAALTARRYMVGELLLFVHVAAVAAWIGGGITQLLVPRRCRRPAILPPRHGCTRRFALARSSSVRLRSWC